MKLEDAERILKFYEYELKDAPCSSNHHLNVRGGLMIHLKNTFGIAKFELRGSETLQALALIHDVGKARTYKISDNKDFSGIIQINYTYPAVDHLINTIAMISEAGALMEPRIQLTQEELHALQFHHGGWSQFSKNANLTELAIKLHAADMLAMSRENNNDHNKEV